METNLVATREPRPSAFPRYAEIARALTGAPDATAEELQGTLVRAL